MKGGTKASQCRTMDDIDFYRIPPDLGGIAQVSFSCLLKKNSEKKDRKFLFSGELVHITAGSCVFTCFLLRLLSLTNVIHRRKCFQEGIYSSNIKCNRFKLSKKKEI